MIEAKENNLEQGPQTSGHCYKIWSLRQDMTNYFSLFCYVHNSLLSLSAGCKGKTNMSGEKS